MVTQTITVEKANEKKAQIYIDGTTMLLADRAHLDHAGLLCTVNNNIVTAKIETAEPAFEIPNAIRRAIKFNEDFEIEYNAE